MLRNELKGSAKSRRLERSFSIACKNDVFGHLIGVIEHSLGYRHQDISEATSQSPGGTGGKAGDHQSQ